jgi:hypothetical protein
LRLREPYEAFDGNVHMSDSDAHMYAAMTYTVSIMAAIIVCCLLGVLFF